MSTEHPTIRPSFRHRFAAWATGRPGLGRIAALILAVVAIGSVLATYVTFTGAPPFGSDHGSLLLLLLTLNLVLLLVFGAIVAKRLVEIWTQRRRGQAGSRLHIRLVVLFSAVAVTPTIIVAIFSYLFLSFGMESWFSDKVRTAIEESRAVAQAYLEEHQQNIRADALEVAADINRNAFSFARNPKALSAFIDDEVRLRGLTEGLVYNAQTGAILGQSAFSAALSLEKPPSWAFAKALTGEVAILNSEAEDRVRALVAVEAIPNAMLYVGRPVDTRVLNHLIATNAAVTQYERLEGERSGYQIKFILIFGAAALLLLLAAVWFGVNFASQISRRISGLVVAAQKVGSGDLSARTAELDENDEFGSLSRAFNLMTQRLETQQTDLVEANLQLDLRRRFTETVLSGVSAGVIGLDERGLVNLPNKSASLLLDRDLDALQGLPLAEIVPEMAPLIAAAMDRPDRLVEGQIRLLVGARAMVLLVRIASEQGPGATPGYVVTFDDITELLSAQRKAAWADVARRIAHEMKNPLTPIQLSAERLKRKYLGEIKSDPDTFTLCTDTIIRQVGDIGRMVDEFSSFARMPAPLMRRENLLELTRQGVFLQRTAHPEIDFTVDLPQAPVEVSCDSRQISQALTNLLQNAIDSIQARQVAETAAGNTGQPGRIRVRLLVESSRTILSVEDNGKGLPKEGRENLTEPYVTTRAKGTGLGLAIVKKIMEDHAGELILDDGSIGGAGVSLAFPGGADQAAHRPDSVSGVMKQTEVVHGA
ncbi:sensor histidine kinase NtrY-like [Aliidongia dinghuensis]|uniref:sensor histidine kinase NtrY-like n=1 Tax=Aliidongia dinghuensis TaxID=1867774 RepID=UPI001669E449|nr:PAS domain-containing sensor histidine kinase [Aliidongia dinghuensis]